VKVDELTSAYLKKAKVRFEALLFYKDNEAYSDVVSFPKKFLPA